MKRSSLKRCLKEIVDEYSQKSFEYWDTVTLPVCFERSFEGRSVQIEICECESTLEYRRLDISVDGGGLSAYFPVGQLIVVKKKTPYLVLQGKASFLVLQNVTFGVTPQGY